MTNVYAAKLELPHAAFGVSIDALPRHMTIAQADYLAREIRRAIRDARKANDELRNV